MDHQKHIQDALNWIEENLQHDIRPSDMARVAGYSEYHFLRLFKETVGLTPADYIRKRRISEIVRRMATEPRPISDIAFEYGFNSKENFIRAFKREHSILPTEYRNTLNSLKLYDRVLLSPPPFRVKASVSELSDFRLVVYPCSEPSPPQCWNRYNIGRYSKRLSGGKVAEDFGISAWNQTAGQLDYYIGIREEDAQGDRSGTVTLKIPGGTYAVFETPPVTQFEFVQMIHRTWDYIGSTWLRKNGYRRTGGYELECYVEKSRLFSERIFIPIIKERTNEHEKTECDMERNN